jgi:hypothetical protein
MWPEPTDCPQYQSLLLVAVVGETTDCLQYQLLLLAAVVA